MSKIITRVGDIQLDSRNANKHTVRGVKMMHDSLQECGYGDSITVDKNGVLISGENRTETAVDIGLDAKPPIVVQTTGDQIVIHQRLDLDITKDDRARKLAIYQNRVAEVSLDWDADVMLAAANELDLTGLFDASELAEITAGAGAEPVDAEPQTDKAEELRVEWDVKNGQIWEVGKHRVMCGDSFSGADVMRLLDGAECQAVVTDPPYEMPVTEVRCALNLFAPIAVLLTTGKQAFNLCRDGWDYRMDLVWHHRQPRSFPTTNQPVMYHNIIVIMAKTAERGIWQRPDKGYGSIVEFEEVEFPRLEFGQTKAPQIFIEMMKGIDKQIWGDPFLGGGTSLLAAGTLGRIMYGMEKEARHLAVALQRFKDAGMLPRLISDAAGYISDSHIQPAGKVEGHA